MYTSVSPLAGAVGVMPPDQMTEEGQVTVIVAEGVTFSVNEEDVPDAGGLVKAYATFADGVCVNTEPVDRSSVGPASKKAAVGAVKLDV